MQILCTVTASACFDIYDTGHVFVPLHAFLGRGSEGYAPCDCDRRTSIEDAQVIYAKESDDCAVQSKDMFAKSFQTIRCNLSCHRWWNVNEHSTRCLQLVEVTCSARKADKTRDQRAGMSVRDHCSSMLH